MASRSRIIGPILLVLGSLSGALLAQDDGFEKSREDLLSADPARRLIGSYGLLRLPDERGIAELRRVLEDPKERGDVAITVLQAVADDRDARLLESMVGALGDRRPGVAEAARASWRAFQQRQDVIGKLLALAGEEHRPIEDRVLAVNALGHTRSVHGVGPLIEHLTDLRMAGASLAALGEITRHSLGADAAAWRSWWVGDPAKGIPAHEGWTREEILEEAIDVRGEERVNGLEAALAKEMIELVNTSSADELQTAIQSTLWQVRAHAATHLGKLGGDRAAGVLLQRLDREEHLGVLVEIATSLGKIGDPRASGPLTAILAETYARRSPNPGFDKDEAKLATELVIALGNLGNRESVPEVARIASDPLVDKALRAKAVETLGKLGCEEAFQVLYSLAREEKEGDILRVVAQALGRIGIGGAVEPLLLLLERDDPVLRCHAVDSLGKYKDPSTIPVLCGRLADPEARVRGAAATALGSFGGEQVVEPIGRLLATGSADPDVVVRRDAAEALRSLASEAAIPALVDSQGDADPQVRAKGWEALLVTMAGDRERKQRAAVRFLERSLRPDHAASLYRDLLPGARSEERGFLAVGLARALVAMGEPAAGAAELAKVLEALPAEDPAYWAAHLGRVQALARAGRAEEARAALARLSGEPAHADHAGEIAPIEQSIDALARGSASDQAEKLLARFDLDDEARAKRFREAGTHVVRALEIVLDSRDPALVWQAVRVLRTLSGASYGFDPARPLADQADALEKWREWIRNHN